MWKFSKRERRSAKCRIGLIPDLRLHRPSRICAVPSAAQCHRPAAPGFPVIGFTPAQQAAKASHLRQEGFVAGVYQNLRPTSGADPYGDAICYAEKYKTPKGAAEELRYQKQQEQTNVSTGGSFKPFAVPAIPGAFGDDASSPAANGSPAFSGQNVLFVVGSDVVLVGVGYSATASPAPKRQLVSNAATGLYRRLPSHA